MSGSHLDLERDFGRFDILQLVRTLLRPPHPGAAPLEPERAVRFRADLASRFPGSNASELKVLEHWTRITTPDFCVGSVLGPLPEAFLEWMRDLERAGACGMRDFLDVFNHRVNVLRFRMRATFEPGLHNGRPEETLQADWLGALMGVGSQAQASQIPLRQRHWLGIGGLLANNRRSAAAVVQVLSAHLRCPVRLQSLVPQWQPFGHANEHRLGQRRLAADTWLGRSLWDVQAAVRVVLGPLPYSAMIALLPPLPAPAPQPPAPAGPASARDLQRAWRGRQLAMAQGLAPQDPSPHEALVGLLRLMLDRRQDVQLRIELAERQVPPSLLTAAPPAGSAGLRLGQTAWLKARRRGRDGPLRRGARTRLRLVRLAIPAFPALPAPEAP